MKYHPNGAGTLRPDAQQVNVKVVRPLVRTRKHPGKARLPIPTRKPRRTVGQPRQDHHQAGETSMAATVDLSPCEGELSIVCLFTPRQHAMLARCAEHDRKPDVKTWIAGQLREVVAVVLAEADNLPAKDQDALPGFWDGKEATA